MKAALIFVTWAGFAAFLGFYAFVVVAALRRRARGRRASA